MPPIGCADPILTPNGDSNVYRYLDRRPCSLLRPVAPARDLMDEMKFAVTFAWTVTTS